jgi:hypothetical protein
MNNIKDIVERLRSLGFEARAVECSPARPSSIGPSMDYADLSEKEFRRVISKVDDLATLEGIANRSKFLKTKKLKKWSEVQRSIILEQKFKLEAKTKIDTRRRGKARTANAGV